MTCDVSKTKPTNFVSCGPIGTGSVPFVFVRPGQSEFRVEFVQKWTRERQRPLKRLGRQPAYCNRRSEIREQAICLLQPSAQRHVDVARVRPMTSPSFSYFTSSTVDPDREQSTGRKPSLRRRSNQSFNLEEIVLEINSNVQTNDESCRSPLFN